jgi:hypothetical protein
MGAEVGKSKLGSVESHEQLFICVFLHHQHLLIEQLTHDRLSINHETSLSAAESSYKNYR